MTLPYEGATEDQLRSPFVQEFLAIHDMFRDQLAEILAYVEDLLRGDGQLDGPDTAQHTRALIHAGTQYTQYLHMHHSIETDGVFPLLQDEGLDPAIVARLNAEHDELSVLIDRFHAAILDLAAVEPDVLNNDMRRLADALRAHLAYEETHVCPLMARWTRRPDLHLRR
ncbi:MAG TPA: hemerythrin domain-containing protein [Aggregatilinea sp.]|uniref:hemerythrin domain-containing protein n=1 Tax=Aggregatilinea sp. TaxID=2806333 RepID=UPI002BF193BE|nr:hemerythrin domain-containing protein [Aggregatilinea sp.]HML21554.1 hemerythrin domain-containing protein [Aggregatilinea sp.]